MTRPLKTMLPWAMVALVLLGLGLWRHARPEEPRLRVWQQPGKAGRYETRFSPMGTDARLVVRAESTEDARRMLRPAVEAVRRVERLMSAYRPDSEVSRLNEHTSDRPVAISPETLEVLRRAVEMSRLTDGAFDVTYAPLRTLWRRAAERGKPPSEQELEATLQKVGSQKLAIQDGRMRVMEPGMKIDLGGIAKGYAIDAAIEAMRAEGASAALVDIGGDLRLLGRPGPDEPWRIRVRPVEGMKEGLILALPPCAVTTSGDYARGLRIGERWFSHIIDPRTGRPVASVPSATVVARDATTADALATAISVLGPREGVALVNSLPETECLVLSRREDGSLERHPSSGFDRYVSD